MMKKVCRNCRAFTEKDKCPFCGGKDFTTTHSGVVQIIDPEKSEVAKEMKVDKPGKFSVKVR